MHVVIVGNGITGITAALRLREKQPAWRITVVSGESTHHYSRPALMYLFMGHMAYRDVKPFPDYFWRDRRLDLVRDWVTGIDIGARRLLLYRRPPLSFDKLLIATGSKPNKFGWPGQELPGVQGLWGLPDLRLLAENAARARHAVIVGGGLIGIELCEMLLSRGVRVTFLVREQSYWDNVIPAEESRMINRVILHEGVGLKLETELRQILDDGTGRVGAVVTSRGERIECQLVGLTAGVSPNVDLVKGTGIATRRGVLVDARFRTSVPDVYAAGDCAEIEGIGPAGRGLVQQVWYTGKMQGEVAADAIAGVERAYDPGIWFNSAKFFDLEYQVYGRVNMRVENEKNLYWEHPNGRHAVRIVHAAGSVIGFNLMGIRWRHEVCERWIRETRDVSYVLDHVREAWFEPELSRRLEATFVPALRRQLAETPQASIALLERATA